MQNCKNKLQAMQNISLTPVPRFAKNALKIET